MSREHDARPARVLNIFTRREVQVFSSLGHCEEAARALEGSGIPTQICTRDRFSPSVFSGGSRERSGTFLQKGEAQYQHTLYVHRLDYDAARELLCLTGR